jgi:ABC-type multidrug transport system ATPase subunit
MPAIVVENLVKTYRGGAVKALAGVSLALEPGESVGIIGPNGAGKTTLMGCLLGFLRPDSGRLRVDGRDPDDLANRAVTGYLPERLVLDRWMRGLDFLEYHHGLARLPRERRRADAEAALDRVGLEASAGRQPIRAYSRGMLQRLGLAQALLGDPRLLFLDEPISGVDPAGVLLFRRLLAEQRARGATLLINSHRLDEIERSCDRVVFVKSGRIEAIEVQSAGAAHSRVLRVRFAAAAVPARAALDDVASRSGAALEEVAGTDARFRVADDAGATRLLAALLAAGLPVVEAAPEEGRLERLFAGPAPTQGPGA